MNTLAVFLCCNMCFGLWSCQIRSCLWSHDFPPSALLSVDLLCYLSQGISATALKKACRELGVERWPRRKRQSGEGSSCTDDQAHSSGAARLSDDGDTGETPDLMEVLHRNAIMVLQAAKKLDEAQHDSSDESSRTPQPLPTSM